MTAPRRARAEAAPQPERSLTATRDHVTVSGGSQARAVQVRLVQQCRVVSVSNFLQISCFAVGSNPLDWRVLRPSVSF